MKKFFKQYDNYDVKYNDFVKISKLRNGSVMFKYYFEFSHVESLDIEHIKSTDKPEYVRTNKNHRIIYYENVDKRERIILDETKICKRGQKSGSTNSNKKTRKTKDTYKDVVRTVKLSNGSVMFKYYFEFSHVESLDIEHIKSTEKPEYIKTTQNHRIVYYENIDKRERIILDKTKIEKRGRKYGSKDSYQRTRRSKDELK